MDGKTGLATPSFVRTQLIYNALATVANSAYLSLESLGFFSGRAAALDLANFKLYAKKAFKNRKKSFYNILLT